MAAEIPVIYGLANWSYAQVASLGFCRAVQAEKRKRLGGSLSKATYNPLRVTDLKHIQVSLCPQIIFLWL